MNTAIKHDENKPQLDLLPEDPLIDIARVLMKGKETYGRDNWRKGLAWSRCYAAALRHLFAWHKGETNDPETGLNHLAHAACEILFLLEFSRTHLELDDRPSTLNPSSRLRPGPTPEPEAETPKADPEQKSWIDCVKEFNKAYDVPVWDTADCMSEYEDAIEEQIDLINEECDELFIAYDNWKTLHIRENEVEILDAICDSIYVLIGLALKMSFDLDGAFREVHRSNMSKLGKNGKPIKRSDGKVLKGPNFTPPKLEAYI